MQWPREVDVGLEPPEKNAWPNSACATGAHGHALAQAVSTQRGNPGTRGVTSGMSLPSLSLSFPCCQRGRWPPPASEPPPRMRRAGGRYPHTSTENPSRAVLTPSPDLKGPHPRSQSSETILWKESKHPEGSRAQERSSGAWLLARLPQSSCHHGCTSARPICLPGTFPRLGGGAWALLETDPLPLRTWSIVPGSGE